MPKGIRVLGIYGERFGGASIFVAVAVVTLYGIIRMPFLSSSSRCGTASPLITKRALIGPFFSIHFKRFPPNAGQVFIKRGYFGLLLDLVVCPLLHHLASLGEQIAVSSLFSIK
jgi:hypothetical protein